MIERAAGFIKPLSRLFLLCSAISTRSAIASSPARLVPFDRSIARCLPTREPPDRLNRSVLRCDSAMKLSRSDMSDDEVRRLLGRLAERDERALRELYERFAARIFLYAVARLRDEDAARTVMLDTLFEVWKHPDRFRGGSRFSTWILGIARHKLLSALRSRASVREVPIGGYVEAIADPTSDVEQEVEENERLQLLMQCLDRLNDAQREGVQLVYLEGLALTEVAALQKVPEGAVKTRLYHGRRNLRDCVERRMRS
jgi:RNA polymerase sigma-70 factor (ECF subfamily)